ncbi:MULTISPECIES: MFS transporter [Glutamicibacter]|uniref:Aromatic acid transporter n=1 Tax=Glutamicibacter arilaitensis (strain DSM 16368 / CIP 108037 / IAM 15318 / JCM 13566 / NCIMB 14258 / Re117) TaxID=861360 RepID=A0ABM9PUJ9_GLUAR|nr:MULTISPECIES: MFS transporter [Glutamicibacter]CBT74854.1 putative aromatic acid transporter [Glutamicibacter arilaitensis Re117]
MSSAPLPSGTSIVQELPFKWKVQGTIFIIGGLGFMFDAWDVTLNGALIPLVAEQWGLDRPTAALLGTSNLVGMALGAFLWGGIADRYGRKNAFSLTLLMFSLFTILGALSPNFGFFVAFRFLAGVGLGGCIPVDYALVGEFTPSKLRGRVLTAMDGWWPVGAALSFFVSGWVMATADNWRLILAVMILPAFMVYLVRRSMPESPLFLAAKGRDAEARAVIDQLVERTGADKRDYVIEPVQLPKAPRWWEQVASLWKYSWKITATSWLLFMTILLVYYLALTWLPSILTEAGMAQSTSFFATAVMALMGLVGVVIAALLVERVGRKWLLAISAPISGIVLIVVAQNLQVPATAIAWVLVFGVVVQVAIPVLYAYVSELYPTELRASGFGWASTMSRFAAGFGPLLFAALWPVVGLGWLFAGATVLVLLAVLFMSRFAPETRGMRLD